ncbi:cytochrome P450 [Microtetraspora niveoalba]|uniref:cytochrome P450 n=1 Tax=Microtetraspora niveoalba TaxID=46175 RepID=UPI0008379BAA|nr:cytochrome P450 [Microtetraspora niveoalba]
MTQERLIDALRPEWLQDPYGLYRRLRERSPIYWDDWMRSWVVLGHADITRLGKSGSLSGARIADFHERLPKGARAEMAPLAKVLSDMMLFTEPPRHTRLRRLVRPGLTPRFIRSMRPMIERLAESLLDAVIERGRLDVIEDFSEPLTRGMIAELAGVPPESAHLLENWQGLMHEFFTQSSKEVGRIQHLHDVFGKRAAERAAGMATDRFSEMIAPQVAEDEFSDDEIFANFILLIDAGQATTTHLIANAVLALIRHPDQIELLRRDPALAANAAHELMRYDSAVQFTTRIAEEDIDVPGHAIKRGQSVTLVLGSGNRDPLCYQDPDRLDVTRKATDHLSFGHGIHYCLGASLALAEIEIAIATLLRRCDDLRLGHQTPEWLESINFRFLKSLPITFTPRQA